MSLDPRSPSFWDEADLHRESLRVHQVCADCRLCFKFCGSFPSLFRAVDAHDGDVQKLTAADLDAVVDLCFQCKLCYVNCPYTPPHDFAIDFPRLMLRTKLVQKKRDGLTTQDRILSDPIAVGRLGGAGVPFSNWSNRLPAFRRVLEMVTGIDRRRELPQFHRTSFASWFRRRPRRAGANGRVVFFATCSVNHNWPRVGRAIAAVFRHNDVEVQQIDERCCGMPALESGDLAACQKNLEHNVQALLPWVEKGYTVVMPQPTCGYMFKQEYPWLGASEAARKVAAATQDVCEYLMGLSAAGLLKTDFRTMRQEIAYHFPCHLKAQNVGYKSRDLLSLIPGTTVQLIDRCSGMDGTFGMKRETYDESLKVGKKLFDELSDHPESRVVSDCTLAGLQLRQGTGRLATHPVEVICEAYGLDPDAD